MNLFLRVRVHNIMTLNNAEQAHAEMGNKWKTDNTEGSSFFFLLY